MAVILMLSSTACDEGEIAEVSEARVVVEGFLHANQSAEVQLTKEILFKALEDEKDEILDDLIVSLSDGNESVVLSHTEDGRYVNESFLVEASKDYTLSFDYNGQPITAITAIPNAPAELVASKAEIKAEPFSGGRPTNVNVETMNLTWENPDGDYYMVVIIPVEDDPEQINTSGFTFANFRSEPLITSNFELRSTDFVYYGDNVIILYRLNPEYASLYLDSGESSLDLSTPFSNITNGLGILTGINSDTVYVNVHNN